MPIEDDVALYEHLIASHPHAFATALGDARVGILLSNWENQEFNYNSTLRSIHGLPEEGLIDREYALNNIVHPDDIDHMRRLGARHMPKGEPYSFRHRMRRANGRYFSAVTHVTPILNEDGDATQAIAVLRDLDELERAINRMDRAEHLAGLGNWTVDLVTEQVIWSKGAFEVFGYEPGEIAPDLEFVRHHYVGRDVDRVSEVIDEALETGKNFEYRARITTKMGEERHVQVTGEVETDVTGTTVAYSGIVQDITDEVISEAQIRQSQKMEAIGNMTGGVAHDFNNLLAIILGNLEMMRDEIDRPDLVEMCEAAMSATLSGAALTRNMLSFARRAPLDPTTMDVNDAVRGLERWARRTLPETIDPEVSLQAGLWKTDLDKGSLESALLNLILNARDAMPAGGKLTIETGNVTVDEDYIETREEDIAPGRYVMLAVSDTGTGIPQEELQRIFEPFFTTKETGKGTGLGLSMVMGFAKQSSGTVQVYSELGEGTTVKLYFPARHVPSGTGATAKSGQVSEPVGNGLSILLAEDEVEVQQVLAKSLRKAGYQVHATNSGEEAKAAFEANPDFDLLLTDIVMPGGLHGTTLAKELRRIRPDLPVVFMSGYANEATVHGNGLRPDDIRLMKPVRRANLLEAITKALRVKGGLGPGRVG